MANLVVEERVSTLETVLADYIATTTRSQLRLDRALEQLSKEMSEFKDEMREFKDEMGEFKDEMREFKDEMREFKDEMGEFKDEMGEFKDEMGEFKNESRREMKEMKKQWGDLANKMGTLVEDIIAPAVRPVMTKYFGEEIEYIAVNVRKNDKAKNLKGEFDVIAASESFVFLIETKSRPRKEHLEEFMGNVIPKFQTLFPEFSEKQFIPVFASLRFEDFITDLANSKKVYLLAYREWEYMDILNFDAIGASVPT